MWSFTQQGQAQGPAPTPPLLMVAGRPFPLLAERVGLSEGRRRAEANKAEGTEGQGGAAARYAESNFVVLVIFVVHFSI